MADFNKSRDTRPSLEQTTIRLEKSVHTIANTVQVMSSVFAGAAAYNYMAAGDAHPVVKIGTAVAVGLMTGCSLIAFTSVAIKILPRLEGSYRALGGAAIGCGLLFFAAASGTATATLLAYGEAHAIEQQEYIADAEKGFTDAQERVASLGQIVPLVTAARDVASTLRANEEANGLTGGGRGPLYASILTEQTRLQSVEKDLQHFLIEADSDVRAGQAVLERIRAGISDPELNEAERARSLENGLTRLSTITIGLNNNMPLSTLRSLADTLRTPTAITYADDPDVRAMQEATLARFLSEFEPVGSALSEAVTQIDEHKPVAVPTYQHKSPTAVVFEHAETLFYILMLAYSLDALPFLAIGLVLIAHAQLNGAARVEAEDGSDDDDEPPVEKPKRQYRRRLANGFDHDDRGADGQVRA